MITPGYFKTTQTRLLQGRFFTESDSASSTPVAIVNETMARKIASERRVNGKLYVQYAAHDHLEIIGVVADVKQLGLEAPVIPEVYVPVAQMPVKFMTLMIRTSVNPASLTHAASAAIQSFDKDQPVSRIVLMSDAIGLSMAERRFAMILMSLFGGLAVVLAIVGTAGITAYGVAERTKEFAVHIALGASPHKVLQLALRRVLVLTTVGVVIGIGAALLTARFLATMLYSIRPLDFTTFVSVAVALSAIALVASYIPARRAAKVDPMEALRYE
jgi:putative ABC transport system permease protein